MITEQGSDRPLGLGWTLTQQEEVLVVVQCRVPEQVPLVQPQLLPVLQGEVHGYVLEGRKFLECNTLSVMTAGLGSGRGQRLTQHPQPPTRQAFGKSRLVRTFRCKRLGIPVFSRQGQGVLKRRHEVPSRSQRWVSLILTSIYLGFWFFQCLLKILSFLFFNLFYLFIYLLFIYFIYLFIYLFIYFIWVFVAPCGLSLVAESRGYSSLRCAGFSLQWLLLLRSTGSRCAGFSSCDTGSRAQAQ